MSLPGLQVRAARRDDLMRVVMLERGVAEAPHWSEGDYAEILDGSGVRRCLFVAEIEGDLVGFAVGKAIGDIAELESVAVRVEARRAGVGRALCGAVVEWGRDRGATVLELEARAGSAGTLALYERLGFVQVGLRPGYYREPVDDAVLMALKLI